MDQERTHITIILDRTGSMARIRDDTIGGVNSFLAEQRGQPGQATLTLAQFDTQNPYEIMCRFKPIHEVPDLTRDTYVPRAATPLLDAIGHGIRDTEQSLALLPALERPSKIVVVIITDGLENSSREYRKSDVEQMIKEKQDQMGWQFVFLSTDLAGIQEARRWGISPTASMAFCKSSQGMRCAMMSTSARVSEYRSGQRRTMAFTEEDRRQQAASTQKQ